MLVYPLGLLLFFSGYSIFSYAQNGNVTKQECFDFYNHFKDGDLKHTFYMESRISIWEFCFDTTKLLEDSMFTSADIPYILQQIKHPILNYWQPNQIKRATIIDSSELNQIFTDGPESWGKFYERFGNEGYYNLSPPYFSMGRNLCVIYVTHYCGGLCDSGEIYVCKKTGDKWVLIERNLCWIS